MIHIFTNIQIIFTAISTTLALIHLLLFLLDFKNRNNLFYFFFMTTFAVLTYFQFEMFFSDFVLSEKLGNISINLTLLFILFIAYWIHQGIIPVRFYLFLVGSVIFIVQKLFWPNFYFQILFYAFLTLAVMEIIRVAKLIG